MSSRGGRLLAFRLGDPFENMAIDQVLLESVDAGGKPTLRFYGWSEPTLSIGYFQKRGDRILHPASESLSCVRRATGGGAIIHDRELTYSVTMPAKRMDRGAVAELYTQVHAAIVDVLAKWGVLAVPFRCSGRRAACSPDSFLCFQRRTPEDLVVSGYKILGSAQRRGRASVLQHGSLLLHSSAHAMELPGLCDLTSKQVDIEELALQVQSSLGQRLGLSWQTDAISEFEQRRAGQIAMNRFGTPGWLNRR